VILDEVLGAARPLYKLRAICRPVRMDSLTARVDIATGLTGQEKVPPMVEAEIASESYSPVSFDLWKNVVHVVVSDEAIYMYLAGLMLLVAIALAATGVRQ